MSVRSAGARCSVSNVTVALATTTSPPGPFVRRIVNDSWPMRSAGFVPPRVIVNAPSSTVVTWAAAAAATLVSASESAMAVLRERMSEI